MRAKVLVAYLHPGWVPHEFLDSLFLLIRNRQDIQTVSRRSGGDIHHARNAIWWMFGGTNHSHLLWVDADMVFTEAHLSALLALDEPFVGAHAVRVNADGSTTASAVRQGSDGRFSPVTVDHESPDLMEVDGMGMGFTLIKREVAAKVGHAPLYPYRDMVVDGVVVEGDVAFSMTAREAGFTPKLATSVRVGHVKSKVYMPEEW